MRLAVYLLGLIFIPAAFGESLPPERINADRPEYDASTARPLRYRPEGTDFVIENGKEFFNRPLYGGNTAFRVDAGDLPECVMYLPGRGGNLRLGIVTSQGQKWLFEADKVIACYRPGSMVYDIEDRLLEEGKIRLTLLAVYQFEGLVLQAEGLGLQSPVTLVWAYGGVNGQRGSRDGDIGCEREPVSRFFQLKPDYCSENIFEIAPDGFILQSKTATIGGCYSGKATQTVTDARLWNALPDLLKSADRTPDLAVVVGRIELDAKQPFYLCLERLGKDKKEMSVRPDGLASLFDVSQQKRQNIVNTISVTTPDPYMNAAAAALCLAADAVWDEPSGTVQHGAVAWRRRLLGWRGPYANDALGWHERSKRHLTYWAGQQDTGPIPASILPADPEANLSRNEPSLHSNGTMSKSHYDMNLVYIDTLFRHLQWTGDLEFARRVWPVIERHLTWERRLFRRPFNDGNSPLYEAYAAIWASDDLQYSGGGVTHTTAYNYYHNKMAARLAKLLDKDASPYEQEAELILKAMRKELWLPREGWFAEYKDWLGLQRLHSRAGVYTFYHTLDSEVPSALEAWQMSRFVDTQIARIPIHGPGVPEGHFTVPTSNWMPYSWSVNNVVMAEAAHTALAYWQAGRGDAAFALFKGCILDSMYLGLCPGNVGMCTYYDAYRGESQRDFADGVGAVSRGLIEGLFGIRPDVLAGQLTVRPGFPAAWDHASLVHPQVELTFKREGLTERYEIKTKFAKSVSLCLRAAALRDRVGGVKINGQPASWKPIPDAVGRPEIEITAPAAAAYHVEIIWEGKLLSKAAVPTVAALNEEFTVEFGTAQLLEVVDPQHAVTDLKTSNHSLTAKASGLAGHRSIFALVEQGDMDMRWWEPICFEIRPAQTVVASESQDDKSVVFRIQNNTPEPIEHATQIYYSGRSISQTINAGAYESSKPIRLAAEGLLPGMTAVRIGLKSGPVIDGQIVNWNLKMPPSAKQKSIDLSTLFNDCVSQIFKNEYISPRSPFCSLAIPKQGFGGWCNFKETPEIDDSGLRQRAAETNGTFTLPQGVSFQTSGQDDQKNVLFVSMWDNYPDEASVPLAGKADHVYLLMAGSTNSMQCHIDNGEVIVSYADGSEDKLVLHSPDNWWPIDQDFYIDQYAFRRPGPIPPRVDLKTGQVRILDAQTFMKKGGKIPGGAALVLDMPLDGKKELKSLTVRALSNEVIIGLMAVTLVQQ
ncbi:MAG TPA: DUF4450 domain-containing protein [Anaerohalosphaeraceae bacterium]|nr:DUF4450 domain-containing protein [Anaerohalosphaeraceae bacterium]